MIKTTLKSVAIALSLLAFVIVILTAVEGVQHTAVNGANTAIKITVVDLEGKSVHNASVRVGDQVFFTDDKGMSPSIELQQITNCYDSSVTEWGTVTVCVSKEGYTPSFVFNCVIWNKQLRRLTVRMYPCDQSELPYVCYVEAPPDDYVKELLGS